MLEDQQLAAHGLVDTAGVHAGEAAQVSLFEPPDVAVRAARGDAQPARALRLFEKRLLDELGWGLSLESDAVSGTPLEPLRTYRYRIDGGPEVIDGVAEGNLVFSGASLLSLAREDLGDERSLADARRLLRAALDQCLDGRPLRTREVLIAMRAHGGGAAGG